MTLGIQDADYRLHVAYNFDHRALSYGDVYIPLTAVDASLQRGKGKWEVCQQQENRYENTFQADPVRDNKGWDKIVYLKSVILPLDQEHRKVCSYLSR